ncbi:hypothetical protein Q3G72_019176 [Acer saccharum]|nr:hypothetical protein Q3G72_019176 [Acer saccharum]
MRRLEPPSFGLVCEIGVAGKHSVAGCLEMDLVEFQLDLQCPSQDEFSHPYQDGSRYHLHIHTLPKPEIVGFRLNSKYWNL